MKIDGPVRSCVVCRTRCPQGILIRLVRTADREVVLDRGPHRAPGRGAYHCGADTCLRKARQALSRALRCSVSAACCEELATWAEQRRAQRG